MKWLIMIMFGFTFLTIVFSLLQNMMSKDVKNYIFGKITGLENIFRLLEKCNAQSYVNSVFMTLDNH